jgi:multiple sugar transport system substrate-binding protein
VKKFFLALVCGAFILSGCSGLPQAFTDRFDMPVETSVPAQTASVATATVASTLQPAALSGAQPTGTARTPTPGGPLTLRIWVPPQFDPAGGSDAGKLLQERLDVFSQRRPEVQIEVRVKSLDGPGGLYESLAAATAAAQLAMPDLVALPHPLIQTAAIKGLLRPMNGLTNILDDPDWYDYARQLASLQNSIFGLPFAGDAMVQVSQPVEGARPLNDWEQILAAQSPLSFAAADPQALFTLALYRAAGGQISDEQGQPLLQLEPLVRVLEFYKAAEQAGVMPYWLTQFQTDDQAWEALLDKRAGAAITWLSSDHNKGLENATISQLPTPDGAPFTLASGWAWTLASPDPQRRQLAVELAEFLTESSFLARWSEAAQVLPTRPSALAAWKDPLKIEKLSSVAASASLYPPSEVLSDLGPALQEAAAKVLKRQEEPAVAAQNAVNQSVLP